jgi:hypothetical protein
LDKKEDFCGRELDEKTARMSLSLSLSVDIFWHFSMDISLFKISLNGQAYSLTKNGRNIGNFNLSKSTLWTKRF